jgi:enoyl-CoA hydratase/isomerase-like protein
MSVPVPGRKSSCRAAALGVARDAPTSEIRLVLTHYDFLAKIEDTTSLACGPTGLSPLPDMLVRLSRAPVVSIASIRGRATGVGSELALAGDMRFACREKAILSQWEVGAGLVPGGGPMARLPRLMGRGRALEVLLGADDIRGDLAGVFQPATPGTLPGLGRLGAMLRSMTWPSRRPHWRGGRFCLHRRDLDQWRPTPCALSCVCLRD